MSSTRTGQDYVLLEKSKMREIKRHIIYEAIRLSKLNAYQTR